MVNYASRSSSGLNLGPAALFGGTSMVSPPIFRLGSSCPRTPTSGVWPNRFFFGPTWVAVNGGDRNLAVWRNLAVSQFYQLVQEAERMEFLRTLNFRPSYLLKTQLFNFLGLMGYMSVKD